MSRGHLSPAWWVACTPGRAPLPPPLLLLFLLEPLCSVFSLILFLFSSVSPSPMGSNGVLAPGIALLHGPGPAHEARVLGRGC